jgi:copper chaperone NosL
MNASTSSQSSFPHSSNDRYLILVWARIIVFVIGLILAMGTFGCERVDRPVPPEIVFGQHECDVCRMIISDERFAAGLSVEDASGDYITLAFDDIGCMLEYEQSNPEDTIAARYVRDRDSRQWLDATTAVFLHSQTLETPMAFGVAAFSQHSQAVELQQSFPGHICDLAEIERRFRARLLTSDPSANRGSES